MAAKLQTDKPLKDTGMSSTAGEGGGGTGSPSFYYEDQVYRIGKNGEVEFGLVTENWQMYSSDEEEDEDEDEGPSDKVPQGHVAVTWFPKNKDEVVLESKVHLSDRSLMPGDVVRRLISGKDAQCGYCRSVKVFADVQVVGTKKVIPGVLASNLPAVQQFQPDIAIYLDSWIGVIRDVKYLLSVKFTDNSACVVDSAAIEDRFQDVRRNVDVYGGDGVYYPGQKLRGPFKCLKDAEFSAISDELRRAKDKKVVCITVLDVTPTSANVMWQWQTPNNTNNSSIIKASIGAKDNKPVTDEPASDKPESDKPESEKPASDKPVPEKASSLPPNELISGDDFKKLKCLNIYESCSMQIGDICYYTPTAKDTILERNDWKKVKAQQTCNRSKKLGEFKKSIQTAVTNGSNSTEKTGESIKPEDESKTSTETTDTTQADKDDADDEYETLESTPPFESNNNNKLSSIESKNSSSHTCKKLKLCTRSLRKKKLKKAVRQQPPPEFLLGKQTVVEALYTRSLVDVVWQDGTQEEGVVSIDLYPVHHLDDHEFFPGDFVVLAESQDFRKYGVVQSMDHAGRVAFVKWFEAYSFTGDQKPSEVEVLEMSVYDLKDHPDFRFRPGTLVIRVANYQGIQYPAGQIMDNQPDGQVRVCWANGEVTSCWPQDLFRLGDYDSDDGEIWDDNDNNSDDGIDDEDEDANSDSSWETETEEEPNNENVAAALAAVDTSPDRYEAIGTLIGRIQKSLVTTRELIIASSSVSSVTSSDKRTRVTQVQLGEFDERGLTKKLLEIYKNCQYLDKIMGTKFFDVEHLKKWHKDNETSSTRSNKIFEHITRLFRGNRESSGSPAGSDKKAPNVENGGEASKKSAADYDSPPEIMLYELCSVILTKLVEAHTAYEKRFGSFKSQHSHNGTHSLLQGATNRGIEAIAACFGGKSSSKKTASSKDSSNSGAEPGQIKIELVEDSSSSGAEPGQIKIELVEDSSSPRAEPGRLLIELVEDDDTLPSSSRAETSTSSGDPGEGPGMLKIELVEHVISSPRSKASNNSSRDSDEEDDLKTIVAARDVDETSSIRRLRSKAANSSSRDSDEDDDLKVIVGARDVDETSSIRRLRSKARKNSSRYTNEEDDLRTIVDARDVDEIDEPSLDLSVPIPNFSTGECVPDTHRYRLTVFQPHNHRIFLKTVQRELALLQESLPEGILVKGFEDRLDLYSVMIKGPEKTPYEDGLFVFDIHLPPTYSTEPPMVHYISFCTGRLNPNLYEEGKICLSLLGTWNGKGTEVWTTKSSLLQLLVSLQGLILCPEPYYNEAGYEKQKGTQHGAENSRMYNENVLIKLVQSMSRMIANPPAPWQKEVMLHIKTHGPRLITRCSNWLNLSQNSDAGAVELPGFPLLPVSKGFSITLKKTLASFGKLLETLP